jgi:hypothetical protein
MTRRLCDRCTVLITSLRHHYTCVENYTVNSIPDFTNVYMQCLLRFLFFFFSYLKLEYGKSGNTDEFDEWLYSPKIPFANFSINCKVKNRQSFHLSVFGDKKIVIHSYRQYNTFTVYYKFVGLSFLISFFYQKIFLTHQQF